MKFKRRVCRLLLLLPLLPLFSAFPAEAAVPFRTFVKGTTYPLEDTILTGVEPNVLFFLDTSSAMLMSTRGELPTFNRDDKVMREYLPLMRDATTRANMMEHCTFGSGARPVSWSSSTPAQSFAKRTANGGVPDIGTEASGFANSSSQNTASTRVGYTRYGKDVDSKDNVIGNPDHYYSPDPDRPYLLTFKNLSHAKGHPSLRDGQKVELNSPYISDLVPNDSKLYQMKLVLWRLLQEENAPMLSGMRIGVAGNFFEAHFSRNGSQMGALYRRAPFYTNDSGNSSVTSGNGKFSAYHNGKPTPDISFLHGTAPETYSGIPGGDYGNAEISYATVLANYDTDKPTGSDPSLYLRHAQRAYMRVPFDYMYTMDAKGAYHPTSSLIAFRELIDGVEQYNRNASGTAAYVNEELYAGGTTLLATSFYGRDGLHATAHDGTNLDVMDGAKAIDYARGTESQRSLRSGLYQARTNTVSGVLMKRIQNSEGLMTGTILGSAIDFFSPFRDLDFNESGDVRGYFPVTGSCQANWMIVFTGGNEKTVPGRDPLAALKNLFLNSKTMRGRHWDGSKWIQRNYEMDIPIRTIFVGLIEPPDANNPDGKPYDKDQAHDSGAKRLRKAITRMAHAGQPRDMQGTPDESVVPYFADNVPLLIETLQSILLQIRAERFAAGAPVVLPLYESGNDTALFSASYEINTHKQWEGAFHKYTVSTDVNTVSVLEWKAEEKMEAQGMDRKVYTPAGREGAPTASVSELRALSDFGSLAGITSRDADFRNWLIAYEGEVGVLGDMEHSGISVIGDPLHEEIAARDKKIYLHTNRGVLHSIDFKSGKEDWAFIPPNVFQERLRHQKFGLGTWYTGDGLARIRSQPLVLLDGMLAAHDVGTGGANYRTILVGNMGWGGNALYAMDVTSPSGTPDFLWAVENVRHNEVEPNPLDGVKRWGAAAGGNTNRYDYSKLGLTIAATEIRTVGLDEDRKAVGILPGGLGYRYGADSQGKAYYIFDPLDAGILREISASSGFVAPSGRSLGMGIGPVTYLTASDGITTREFYTGDSEGNVLHCDTTQSINDWKLKSIFQLRTTVGDRPVAIPRALAVGAKSNGKRWVYGGTADLMVPDSSPERKLVNDEQFIFGLNLENMDNAEGLKSIVTSNLQALKYLKASPDIQPPYGETGTQVEVPSSALGWYLKLRPKLIHATDPTEAEYVTTSPFLYQGVLYVSTHIARTRHPDDDEKCPELGDSKLYALDPVTGAGKWNGGSDQALLFENIKISGISASGGRLFLGVKVLKRGALELLRRHDDLKDFRVHAGGTAIDILALNDGDSGLPPSVPFNYPHLQYWKESF